MFIFGVNSRIKQLVQVIATMAEQEKQRAHAEKLRQQGAGKERRQTPNEQATAQS